MLLCTLCGITIKTSAISDAGSSFCCHGCHAVHQILYAKGELAAFREHALFQDALKAGIISNPELVEQLNHEKVHGRHEESVKYYFEVGQMWCPSCAEIIKLMLLREKGVQTCIVDYTTDLACIEYYPRYINKDRINEMIIRLGYTPKTLQGEEEKKYDSALLLRFIIAAFCSLNIMMFTYPIYASYFTEDAQGYSHLLALLALVASLPLVTYCLWPIFKRCRNSLSVGRMGMETLVVIGVLAAFSLSIINLLLDSHHVYFDSMSAIITLVLLGKIIESRAKFSSKNSILRIIRSTPKRGRKKLSDGQCVFAPIKEIQIGDYLTVVSGEKVILDGIVTEGFGVCDESLMTGESLPRVKKAGDVLIGSTFIQNGSLTYRVTASLEETVLHKIIDRIESDIPHKTSYTRAADKIVKFFVPVILIIACFTGLWTYYFLAHSMTETIVRMMSILLISCPCAIGIAAPLAEAYLIHGLANRGALVRNRGCLNILGRETHFICDKTGTITEGKFHVIEGLNELSLRELSILKGICAYSNHPIAFSIYNSIEVKDFAIEDLEEVIGKGMKGRFENKKYLFGSKDLLKNERPDFHPKIIESCEAKTVVFFASEDEVYTIYLGDRIKNNAKKFVENLSRTHRILLSGDSFNTVQAVAGYCGFDAFYAETSPLNKREVVEKIKANGGIVAMLGDGINDAPVLTAANIGISVISASDISMYVSDIVLTTDNLSVILELRNLALKGQKVIKQNLFWAFFYNIIGISLAVTGYLSPLFAAGSMILSSFIVIFNARRLSRCS